MNNSDINIADILRDCPAGTPLYSRIAGKLELQQVLEKGCDYHPIQAEVIYENENPKNDRFASFTDTGRWNKWLPNGECVLFPSLEMQDWTRFFRRGDVVVCIGLGVTAVFEGWDSEDYTEFRTTVEYDKKEDIWGIKLYGLFHTLDFRKATDNERAQFFAAAEAHYGGSFNSETLKFNIPKPNTHPKPSYKPTFKPYDRVLVRDNDNQCWSPEFFAFLKLGKALPYQCFGCSFKQCIPYEGNEHLLGTTDAPKNNKYKIISNK